jgi:hypothetical protein
VNRLPSLSLPESEALPRVRLCAESWIKNSRQRRLCRERNKKLPEQKKHSAQRLLCREPNKKLSVKKKHLAKISLPRANLLALGKEILKNHFFTSIFFLSSTYTCTKLMLKFDTILTLFAIFNNFTFFLDNFSHTFDKNYKCIKLYSKVGENMIFMFMRHF